ncbi:MAG: hypothetical protein IJ495_04710 [Bacteroidales bacterium]|nr:hypothetical protein [Bacteroidales bacterium]
MDTPFVYDKYVTGRNFVGRKTECNVLANLLEAGEQVAIYEPPKSGKMSVVQQTLYNMRTAGRQFLVAWVNLFNVRSLEEFLVKYGTAVIKPMYSTPAEYADVIGRHLEGTHFVFDAERFASAEEIVSLNWGVDGNDVAMMLRLPSKIAAEKGLPFYVIIEEFQNLMRDDRYEELFKEMECLFAEKEGNTGVKTGFILTGSLVNAMKYIFEEKKYFYRQFEHLPLEVVDDRDVIEHIIRGFRATGKVIERDLVIGACRLFRANMWYLNHFVSICDSMSRGYLNEGILMEALKTIVSVHEPRFISMVNDLTDHQLSFMRAVLDGVVKFSASDVIEKYRLNSSANVRRVKDALKKKEIITFNEKDEPVIQDPLFEYWITKTYFERR